MAKRGKIARIVDEFTARLESGALETGDSLPSLRSAAVDFDVSKNTIVEAYARLAAAGLIVSRPGSGFAAAPRRGPKSDARPPERLARALDMLSLMRAQLERDYSVRVGDGRPPASWAARLTARGGLWPRADEAAGYGDQLGEPKLRELIAARSRAKGIALEPDQIVSTMGANHALDLIIRRYLSPGDAVLVDDPGYYPLFAKLNLEQISYHGVRRGASGPDLEDLEAKARRLRPKLFFTQSLGQNPTGSSMDMATAHGVLRLTALYGVMVVDDDPFADLPGLSGVRLAALDQHQTALFLGSFSKVSSPAFRVGYVAGSRDVIAELAELKMITVVGGSRFAEIAVARLIETGRYQTHLNWMSRRLAEASEVLGSMTASLGLRTHSPFLGGLYSYVLLPEAVEEAEFVATAAQDGIFIAPGSAFHVCDEMAAPAMRVNLARAADQRFARFLRAAMR